MPVYHKASKLHFFLNTYKISIFENFSECRIHIVMIQSHEKGVDHNAQGNKEVNERIEDDES